MAERMPRHPVKASLWAFTPGEEDPDVQAMEAAVVLVRSDEHVNLTVRGKPGRRYEEGDSVWLEFTHREALRLIAGLAAALGDHP